MFSNLPFQRKVNVISSKLICFKTKRLSNADHDNLFDIFTILSFNAQYNQNNHSLMQAVT